ncbi:MAG TPA: acyl-CoA dehydrogenase family protein [Dehalococcoidales bacterium]|nr:acyl-CoA dehydrogenase family protein [Dehalococcoidales bacterium]
MDFNLSEQQRMLQRAAKDFAVKAVKPRAAEIDSSGQFPFELAKEIGRRGYQGLPYPAEYGGSGAGYLSYALALEQLCQASMTVGAIMAINTVPEEAIFRFGNDEQKKRFLSPLAQGEKLGGIAFTEAETGSDPNAITTTSKKSGDGYIINGQKHFVALALAADLTLVFTKGAGKGLNAFVIDISSKGYSVREPCETMGLKGLGTSVVYLDDVRVPEENLLGKEGQGFDILREAISLGRLGAAVEGVAVAQAALDISIDYAKQRKAMGKPIAKLPTIQWHLAEMAGRIEAGRLLVYRAAFARDQGQDIKYESSLAKLFSSRIAVEVTGMAMQVGGSYGTMTTMPLERLYRDAKMTEIYVGISEIQRNIIAERLIE